jgi:transposase
VYLGKLSKFDESQRLLLVDRIDQLLSHRYYPSCSDKLVEERAQYYVGKLHSRSHGHSESGSSLEVSGGFLEQSQYERVDLKSMTAIRVRETGAEWLCYQVLELLEVSRFLMKDHGFSESEANMALLIVIGRLVYPSSDKKTVEWLSEQSGGPDLLSKTLEIHRESLYQVSRKLLSIHDMLEDYLYHRFAELVDFSGTRYLYDITNTYFEGRMLGSSLASYARSKEKRNDCPLVSIGLLANDYGFIRRSHFYEGNVGEPGTFEAVLEYVGESEGILTDAGIGTSENIEKLAVKGIGYMCVVRAGFSHYQVDFEQGESFEHKSSNGDKYQVWVQTKAHPFQVGDQQFTDWLIFVKSEAKQAKEDGIVAGQRQRFEKGIRQIRESLSKPKGHKKIAQVHQRIGRLKAKNTRVSQAFDIKLKDDGSQVTHLQWSYDPDHEQRNGTYIIRTSLPVEDPKQAWQAYNTFTAIEAVNRCCKTDLNMRPVYHQKDEPIKAHLFLTLLACNIATFIRYLLAKKGIRWSWKEIVRIMNTQKVILSEFTNDLNELFLLSHWSKPESKAREIYDALDYPDRPYEGFFFKIAGPDP